VTNDELHEVVRDIENHNASELALLQAETNKDGTVKQYVARKEDFQPKPRRGVCSGCKFLTICREGKEAVAAL